MGEEEAKTKWCPFARVDSTSSNRPNPGGTFDADAGWPPCIGSACMAWRTVVRGSRGVSERLVGFCGLAGVPL